jgi:hypothetical protein
VKSRALATILAGLIGFGSPFCGEAKKNQDRFPACGGGFFRSFELTLALNRRKTSRLVRPVIRKCIPR